MAFKIPFDAISDVQILLRNEANLSSYDPNNISLPYLPSPEELISDLDTTLPNLRCKNCRGKLLNGIRSMVCVFCGEDLNKEFPPEPIKFKSSFGCRWLLECLELQGTEMVARQSEALEPNRKQNAPSDEISLSDLFDFEIKWAADSEKVESGVSHESRSQSNTSVDFAGVDIDNFFAETKSDAFPSAHEEQLALAKTENNAFQMNTNLNLFDNVNSCTIAMSPTEIKGGDSSSHWNAEFQASGSGTFHEEPKSSMPFVSSSVDLSAHMDTVFGSGKDLTGGTAKVDTISSASTTEWFQDDLWGNSKSSSVPAVAELAGTPTSDKDDLIVENANNTFSTSTNRIEDDQWQSSSNKGLDSKTTHEPHDPFDDWNDFASSTSAQPSSIIAQASGEKTSEINLFGSTGNLQNTGLGGSLQQDMFSGVFSNESGSGATLLQSEISVSDRTADMNASSERIAVEVAKARDAPDESTTQEADNVESLFSQMHDLSFMLKGNLSIPHDK